MLNWLSVRNLAVVESAELELAPGFNAITGETGAGKSVVMGALGLLLGARADKSVIRTGSTHCELAAGFDFDPVVQTALTAFLKENELLNEDEPGTLLLRRVLTQTSTRNFVNGAAVNLGILKSIAAFLVDIHAANENAAVLDAARQLDVLDRFAGLEPEQERTRIAWNNWAALRAEKERFDASLPSPEACERLRRDWEEIDRASTHENEDVELNARHELAAHSQSIVESASAVCGLLTENEESIVERLAECRRLLRTLERIDPAHASEFMDGLDAASESVNALSASLASFAADIEIDEREFIEMENRLRLLQTLKRRYGPELSDVLAHAERIREQLDAFDNADSQRREFQKKDAILQSAWRAAAEELSRKRAAAAARLAEVLSRETQKLGFLKAEFRIELAEGPAGPNGIDRVHFLFTSNPGVPPIPLRDVASSGEVSRIMLAVKTVLAKADDVPTLIFDEIDANIGGETACRVADELVELSKSKQIISISHLPQVAVRAERHFRVEKRAEGERTISVVVALNGKARVGELARMLGGGKSAEQHAKDLLNSSRGSGCNP